MEDYGQILIILVFIAVTLMEGIGRKRKAGQKGQPRPGGTRAGEGRTSPAEAAPKGGPDTSERVGDDSDSSEGLVPQEVWEEILGLARGGTRTETPQPAQVPGSPRREGEGGGRAPTAEEEIPDFEARSLEPLEPRTGAGGTRAPARTASTLPALHREEEAPVRRSVRGTVPVPKSPLASPVKEVRVPGGGAGRKPGVRGDLFGSGTPEELRKAVILREVLGPPVGLRE